MMVMEDSGVPRILERGCIQPQSNMLSGKIFSSRKKESLLCIRLGFVGLSSKNIVIFKKKFPLEFQFLVLVISKGRPWHKQLIKK